MLQKPGGTVCRLTPSNFEELRAILDKGAVAYRKRVKYVIKQAFNIDYDAEHISAISPTGIIVSDIREDSFDGQAIEPEAKRLFLYRIPPYSPELNPTEQLWNNMKNVELKNVFSKNKQELRENLKKTFDKIKQKEDIIKGFFKHPQIVFGF